MLADKNTTVVSTSSEKEDTSCGLHRNYDNTVIFTSYGEDELLDKTFTVHDRNGRKRTFKASENLESITDSFKDVRQISIYENCIKIDGFDDKNEEVFDRFNYIFLSEKFRGEIYINPNSKTLINHRVLRSLDADKFCLRYESSSYLSACITPLQEMMYQDILQDIKNFIYRSKEEYEYEDGDEDIDVDLDLKEDYKTGKELLDKILEIDSTFFSDTDEFYIEKVMDEAMKSLVSDKGKYEYRIDTVGSPAIHVKCI